MASFVVIAAIVSVLTGVPAGFAKSTTHYDTKAECEAHEQEFAERLETWLIQKGLGNRLIVAMTQCRSEDELNPGIERPA